MSREKPSESKPKPTSKPSCSKEIYKLTTNKPKPTSKPSSGNNKVGNIIKK